MNSTVTLITNFTFLDKLDSSHGTPSFTNLHLASIVAISFAFLCRLFLPEKLTIGNVIEIFATALKGLASVSQAKSMTEVVSRPFEEYEMWDEPLSSQELFGGSSKIIWGFWNSYPDGLPWLCQRALESWQLHNPGWTVVMLCDSNFKKYVSTKDLPSTFYSLKVQHQSDLVRLAVLIRYGGIYLDASTLVYKGFDGIWKTAQSDKVLITSLNQLPASKLDFFNNGLLMTKGTGNPFLIEWRRRIMEYSESPAVSVEGMRQHPAFRRVHHHWDDPTLGVLGDMVPYHSNLWLLNDMIWHNDLGLSKHIIHLPKIRWGFFYHSLPHFIDLAKVMSSEEAQNPLNDIEFVQWSAFSLFNAVAKHILHVFTNNPKITKTVTDNVHVLKFTSHDMPLVEVGLNKIGLNSTVGQIVESAFNQQKFTITQANLKGSRTPVLVESAEKAPL